MKQLVFITGAGRGIGQAIALKLVKAGFLVAGCARSASELAETQRLADNQVLVQALDVRDYTAVAQWMNDTIAQNKSARPWGLITAAGVLGSIGAFHETDFNEWKNSVEVNLYGTAIAVQVFTQILVKQKLAGRILLFSGGGATKPMPRMTAYSASKAAVVRFGETIAHELYEHNIMVNCIAPGSVNTKMTESVLAAGATKVGADLYNQFAKSFNKGGESSDKAAALCLYLLSEQANKITGRLISAVWDDWANLHNEPQVQQHSDLYTLRRIVREHLKN